MTSNKAKGKWFKGNIERVNPDNWSFTASFLVASDASGRRGETATFTTELEDGLHLMMPTVLLPGDGDPTQMEKVEDAVLFDAVDEALLLKDVDLAFQSCNYDGQRSECLRELDSALRRRMASKVLDCESKLNRTCALVLKHGQYPCDYLADEWTALLLKFHDKYREAMPAGHFDACVWPFLLWKEKHTTIHYMELVLGLDIIDISPSSIRTCIDKSNLYHLGLPLELQLPYNGVYEFVIGPRFTAREFTVHVLECLWNDLYPPRFVELLDLRFSNAVEAADIMKVTTKIQRRMVCWATRISKLGFDGS
eukprot:CAMPEP_0185749200 /NCGR_PEP_ID=MMETSP1174-20130828/7945_1 /TAXON_ID=35687 /ORGANISM="Dictyocha speculum, Strain CCMP1381" /LENGTH=308 /DNA_ID=CAMNT_0028425225 /DNA_START=100 /DNA_END=1023 /DNA_ORIENTATION=-